MLTLNEARFKMLASFVDMLESTVFAEGILYISLYHSINQKILSRIIFLHVFMSNIL